MSNLHDRKKRVYVIAAIVLAVILFLAYWLFVHYQIVIQRGLDPWGTEDKLSLALKHMLLQPFDVFPFPTNTIGQSFTFLFFIAVLIFYVVQKSILMRHANRDTVAGDAKQMSRKEIQEFSKEYSAPFGKIESNDSKNMILSQDIAISMDMQRKKTNQLNLNSLIIGGSGVGKSFRVIAPNIMQRNASFVITDPSGGLYHKYGAFLEYFGYRVKVFNTDRMHESNHYNPFRYIHSDQDIEELVTMLITNTTSPESGKGDQFWEKCETALFCALIAFLYHYGEADQQNFSNVMRLIRAANVDENDSSLESPLDQMFAGIRLKDSDSFTITQYDTFKLGAGKTLKSILISAAVRLQAFDLDTVRKLTDTDDIMLDKIADEKTALFIIVPTGKKTFNFLAGLMYSQLFDQLYRYCETISKFSQCVVNDRDEVVKVFRAEDKDDSKIAHKQAKEWIQAMKHGKVERDAGMTMVDEDEDDYDLNVTQDELEDKLNKLKRASDDDPLVQKVKRLSTWKIMNDKGEVVGYRGTEKLAHEALEEFKHAKVQGNNKRFNNGESCPIHVSFLLDEFANTGKIPSFVEKISTMRKYEISVVIILQSIKQLENLFKDEWDIITANCDTLVYLGGGADAKTTEWITKLCGKQTVRAMNESFAKNGGSTSIQSQGIELFSMSQLRTMPNQKCIVMPRGKNPCYGDMYDTPHHPAWDLVQACPNYVYDGARQHKIMSWFGEDDELSGVVQDAEIPDHGHIQEEAPDDKEVREKRNEAEERKIEQARINQDDITGQKAILDITTFDPIGEEEEFESVLDANEGEVAETTSEQLAEELTEFSFDPDDMDFSSAGMGAM